MQSQPTRARKEDSESDRAFALQLTPELKELLSVAIHDLRSPLNSSSALAQLLVKKFGEQLPPEAKWIAGQIVTQLKRQAGVINGIDEFISVAANRKLSFAAVPVDKVILAAIQNLQDDVSGSGAEITYSQMPVVEGDEAQLVRMFQHIIENAVLYRSANTPKIDITAESADKWSIIIIRDNGQGFDEAYAEAIFEPFKRLHGKEYPGSGLGLATCRKTAEHHGGRIWAASKSGQGSAFHVQLPLAGTLERRR